MAILDAIEARAKADSAGELGLAHHDSVNRLANAPLASDETIRNDFLELYERAKALVFQQRLPTCAINTLCWDSLATTA